MPQISHPPTPTRPAYPDPSPSLDPLGATRRSFRTPQGSDWEKERPGKRELDRRDEIPRDISPGANTLGDPDLVCEGVLFWRGAVLSRRASDIQAGFQTTTLPETTYGASAVALSV